MNKLTPQIAMLYPNAEIYSKRSMKTYRFDGIKGWSDPNSNPLIACSHKNGTVIFLYPSDCKLILRPLSKITDEDAIEVARILSDASDADLYDPETFNEWMDEIFTGNCATHADYVNGREFQQVLDYLRSKGYDMGYGSIPSLIDAGIAITPSNHKHEDTGDKG